MGEVSLTGQWQFISSSPTWIAVGDFNDDGQADLAGIWGGMIWIRDPPSASWTSITSGATMIAAGDLDGDGTADLIGSGSLPASGCSYPRRRRGQALARLPRLGLRVEILMAMGKQILAGIGATSFLDQRLRDRELDRGAPC